MSNLNVGDKVRVKSISNQHDIDGGYYRIGDIGYLSSPPHQFTGRGFVQFTLNNYLIDISDLELIKHAPPKDKFQIGDEVYISSIAFYPGGTITNVDKLAPFRRYYVNARRLSSGWYSEDDLKLVEVGSKFKVGDKVRTRSSMVGIIKRVDNSDKTYRVSFSSHFGTDIWLPEEGLELVKHETKFKVGDRVRVIKLSFSGHSEFYKVGAEGIIKTISNVNPIFVVKFDKGNFKPNPHNSDSWNVLENEIELVEENQYRFSAAHLFISPKFNVGDKVRITSRPILAGEIGIVEGNARSFNDYIYIVRINNLGLGRYEANELELYKAPKLEWIESDSFKKTWETSRNNKYQYEIRKTKYDEYSPNLVLDTKIDYEYDLIVLDTVDTLEEAKSICEADFAKRNLS